MPVYTYECQKCGYQFDSIERFEVKELPCTAPPTGTICDGVAKRIPSIPAPAKFNCPMPTYQRPKRG